MSNNHSTTQHWRGSGGGTSRTSSSSSSSSSPMSSSLLLRLCGVLIILPFSFTSFTLWNYLSRSECILVRFQQNGIPSSKRTVSTVNIASVEEKTKTTSTSNAITSFEEKQEEDSSSSFHNHHSEIYCGRTMWHAGTTSTSTTSLLAPPSIAVLTSEWIMPTIATSSKSTSTPKPPPKWYQRIESDSIVTTTHTTTNSIVPVQIQNFAFSTKQQSPSVSSSSSSSSSSYGFRRNPNKKQSNNEKSHPLPTTTALLFAMNLFVFLWIKQQSHTRVNQVALERRSLLQDYSRAISGNLAHVEPWHLGFNMMSLSSLGPVLEGNELYGSIPLLLYTMSFLAINTLVVVGLHTLYVRYTTSSTSTENNNNNNNNNNASFNMIGFSGILFTYMVVTTLRAPQTCPIFFLPDLCFDTFSIGRHLKFSLGPIVQLVVLQVILPRASFLGHLAGIVVGFAWHWERLLWIIIPPIDWIQPCVLFPILWMWGRRSLRMAVNNNNNNATLTASCGDPAYSLLLWIRRILTLHWMAFMYCYHIRIMGGAFLSGMWNGNNSSSWSLVVSEGLILVLIYQFDIFVSPHAVVGLITTIWMTDSMTMAGWILTRSLWWNEGLLLAIVLMVSRWILWLSILVVTCYFYNSNNNNNNNTNHHHGSIGTISTMISATTSATDVAGSGGGGVGMLLQWSIMEPCYGLGKVLDDSWQAARSRRYAKERNAITTTPTTEEREALTTSHVI